jgi:hypothetical protein
VTTLQIHASDAYAIDADWGAVRLTQVQHDAEIQPGHILLFDVTAEGQVNGSRKLSLRLVDS